MFYTILVVGLDASASRFLQAIKASMGDVTLQNAATLREAIERLHERPADMILGPLELLEQEGAALIRKAAALPLRPALAIVNARSRQRTVSAILAVRNLGFPVVGSISRPADVADLRSVQVKSLALRAVARAEQLLAHDQDFNPSPDLQIRYKPRINLQDGRVVAVEAVFERESPETELDHVLDKVIAVQRSWRQRGHNITVWLKLPLYLLDGADYPDRLYERVILRGGDPGSIGLDLRKCLRRESLGPYTESIYQLGLHGFAMTHSDAGQGYSFYFRLDVRLFTDVKIFLPLLRSAISNEKLAKSLASIVFESKQSGFTVVAEGVTTAQELKLLRQIGCDEAQGGLIAGLLDEQGVVDLLAGDGGCNLPPDN
ncbi:EAL domain-containing protein [Pseudomonas sp. GM25]|uniref:EAL domain-containing protein n=1 Tax=Pseudomonas sp. GM25 TaxID=1144327 RepID=UPI00026FFC80|nr:EAL domain-containing protein [Pseudomonas sp. GM25]EJM27518.1 EAL domain-containing protein [Pseudomonas sp. GM25]